VEEWQWQRTSSGGVQIKYHTIKSVKKPKQRGKQAQVERRKGYQVSIKKKKETRKKKKKRERGGEKVVVSRSNRSRRGKKRKDKDET